MFMPDLCKKEASSFRMWNYSGEQAVLFIWVYIAFDVVHYSVIFQKKTPKVTYSIWPLIQRLPQMENVLNNHDNINK